MNMIIGAVLSYLKENDFANVALLKCEENANKIAESQGIIAGDSLLRDTICNKFNLGPGYLVNDELPVYPNWANMSKPSLDTYHDELVYILSTEEYKEVLESIEQAFERKKNWLFNEAEKGRDLTFVKGWKKAMESMDKVIEDIQKEHARRKDELPFEASPRSSPKGLAEQAGAEIDFSDPPEIDADQPEVF